MKSEIKQSALIGIERAVVCTVGYSVWNESDRLLGEDNLFSDRPSLTPVRQVLSFHRINSRRRVAPRFTVCRLCIARVGISWEAFSKARIIHVLVAVFGPQIRFVRSTHWWKNF